jgi:molecular chaperone DnaK
VRPSTPRPRPPAAGRPTVADPGNGSVPNPEEDVIDAEVVDDEDEKK